jgi:anti-sigma28 factor (negative regulator of flagellin synthesis)
MNRIFLGIIVSVICSNLSFGQELQEGQKRWSSDNKLTLNDFKIKISDQNNDAAFSQFMISHSIGGFDFMKRNLNQKIGNIFLGNASWIDTTKVENIQKQIDFQQMQFDLAEIEARKFRKQVLKDKNQIAKGFDIVNKINNEIMTELSEIRLEFMKETKSGRNEEKVEEWKKKIATELKELEEFSFENKKKIKLTE